jgi:hypothetical protein
LSQNRIYILFLKKRYKHFFAYIYLQFMDYNLLETAFRLFVYNKKNKGIFTLFFFTLFFFTLFFFHFILFFKKIDYLFSRFWENYFI